MSIPITLMALSDTILASLVTAIVTIGGGVLGFLQWRKTHKVDERKAITEERKGVSESEDKFREDLMHQMSTMQSRMDSLSIINAALNSEKVAAQIQMSEYQRQLSEQQSQLSIQQSQMIAYGQRLDESMRSRDLFEVRVLELTRINKEQGTQIESLETEIQRLRNRIQELERNNHE